MKYRNISLNSNDYYNYNLVKYTSGYRRSLEKLKKLNSELADCVVRCPKLYSESSEHQSYMIFRSRNLCVGAINIETSTNEKNLEIKLHFDEESFKSRDKIFEVIDQLIDSLGLYFYNKESIEINLLNDIDLSKYNRYKYVKKVYDENLTVYVYSNKLNNTLIPKLIDEISGTEKNLIDWGQSWWQEYDKDSLNKLHYSNSFDEDLAQQYDEHTISLKELFNKVESLSWTDIESLNSSRRIEFSRNGNIHFEKEPKRLGGMRYEFDYNILHDGFNLKISHKYPRSEALEINDNNFFTNIKFDNLSILKSKDKNRKKINFISPVIDNSSIALELWVNDQDEIERCYIDFRTHKNSTGKVNGKYALRIIPKYDKYILMFLSRNGNRYVYNQELHFSNNEKLTIDLLNEIIKKLIPIVNENPISGNKQIIAQSNDTIILDFVNTETKVINFVKQIKGEIPLPHLQENLEKFINENDKNKKDSKKRVLK